MKSQPSALSTQHSALSTHSSIALRAVGLVRRYGVAPALRGVSVTLCRGERVALVGPNGAGKTTLIRVLATILRPAAGSLTIGGVDALRQPLLARRLVGVMGDRPCLYGDLTARENLRYYGQLYGVDRLEHRMAAVLEELEIGSLAHRLVRTLSRGQQQRLSLARAILHEPLVLLLDEPETGLDQEAQRRLVEVLTQWASAGRSALVATHRPEWARAVAQRAVVLQDGRVAGEGERPWANREC